MRTIVLPQTLSSVDKVHRKNYFLHFTDGALFVFAMSMVSLQTVIPVFIKDSGGGMIAVGLVPLLWGLAINMPQLFFQPGIKSGFIKRTMLKYALYQRLMYMVMAAFCFFIFPVLMPGISVPLFLVLLTATAFIGSFSVPIRLHFFAKTIETEKRGSLTSNRQFVGSLLGIAAGYYTSRVLNDFVFPYSYGVLFLTAFAVMMLSFFSMSQVEEKDAVIEQQVQKSPIKAGFEILKRDKTFRNYVYTDMLGQWISTSTAFLPVYAVAKFNAQSGTIGHFTAILMIGMAVVNPLLGYIADKRGHKINVMMYHLFTAFACIVAVLSNSIGMFGFVYLLTSVAQAVLGISRIGIVLEMASDFNRRLYVSAIGTFSSIFVLSGIIQGFLITVIGWEAMLISNALIGLTGATLLYKRVEEPRLSVTRESVYS